jgi:hypothetical protein
LIDTKIAKAGSLLGLLIAPDTAKGRAATPCPHHASSSGVTIRVS